MPAVKNHHTREPPLARNRAGAAAHQPVAECQTRAHHRPALATLQPVALLANLGHPQAAKLIGRPR